MIDYAARDAATAQRNAMIKDLWDSGAPVPEIAATFGITPQRVYQIKNNPYSHLVAS